MTRMNMTRRALRVSLLVIDLLLVPLTLLGALVLRFVRRAGLGRLPIARRVLAAVGVLPVRRHYYEPYFDQSLVRHPLWQPRPLPGLDLNVQVQLAELETFHFQRELLQLPVEKHHGRRFYYHNGAFEAGDAEFYYSIIRQRKPRAIIEVGAGHSTLLALEAIAANAQEDPAYRCACTCIEPFENPWLHDLEVQLLRTPVEAVPLDLFTSLTSNDIVFLDSTHVIRPQGDVLREFLEILPSLRPGVLVHIHDIFTPRDYREDWLLTHKRLWNEQYLLEAFLTHNRVYEVIGALNFLAHEHSGRLSAMAPVFAKETPRCEPASFWMRRRS